MNIGVEYLALILSIQKDWKDKNTKLVKIVLQIICDFKIMERNKKAKVMQTSILSIYRIPKTSSINKEHVKKDLITHCTDQY